MAADFDEIAKKLAEELQVRATAAGDTETPAAPEVPGADSIPVEISLGNGDMPRVLLRHAQSGQEAEIYTYGASVTSWTSRGENHFWVSGENKWEMGGKPIRGGIPICFPQFGPYGDLASHGFARNSEWSIRHTVTNADGSVSGIFGLDSETGGDEVAKWPFKFDAEFTVTLSNMGLETKMTVVNKDDKPFSFTFAFHNYFKTTNVKDARIFGYESLSFKNRLDGDKVVGAEEDQGAGLLLTEETDRIYLDAPEELALFDFASLKIIKIKKTPTLGNATLWNPYGSEGCDPGWENFVCIEPACITEPAVLQPGESWVGAQLLGV